jgi:hypothetical protein
MIVTHSNKFLTPKSKVVGCIFNSQLDIPNFFISSNSVNQAKKFWANPASAASYKEAKEVAEKANLNGCGVDQNDFPDFVDLYSKQLFLKTNQGHIIHTPLTSCALVEEFTTKAREIHQMNMHKKNWSTGFIRHQIQPRGVTLGNRGELAVNHGGSFWIKAHPFLGCFGKNDAIKIHLNQNKKYLYFYGSLDNANLNSGFISAGLPAMTAVGGMVESIELKLGYDKPIPFALGLKNCHLSIGGKLGGTKTKSANTVAPVLVTEEKTGSLDFVIVLDVTNFNSTHIANELKKIKRLAGGTIFNYHVSDSISESSEYFFIRNFKYKMQDAIKSGNIVSYLITRRLHPLACGYAILETPNYRNGTYKAGIKMDKSSHKYRHSFSETLFLPIKLSRRLDSKSFFQRKIYGNCTVYE